MKKLLLFGLIVFGTVYSSEKKSPISPMTVENLRAFDGMPKKSKKPKAIEIASVFGQCEEEERHVVETKKKRSYSKSSSYYRK